MVLFDIITKIQAFNILYKEVLKDYKKELPLEANNETISTKDKQ